MNAIVLLKMVPDIVEELEVAENGRALDMDSARMILSETCDHALEQALLLKENYGGRVIAAALDAPEVDDALFTALAKGVDQAVKLQVDQTTLGTVGVAEVFASHLLAASGKLESGTVIMTGAQAFDDLEGELGPCLAEMLALPFVGVVTGLTLSDNASKVVAVKEFSGGLRGEFEFRLPAVVGIQAAEKPPRYVPVAKVRAAMRSAKIDVLEVAPPDIPTVVEVERMYKPEAAGRAEMMDGSPEEISARIAAILQERGLI